MNVQIKRIILLSWIFWISVQTVFSQSQVSKDNYTGAWETSASWSPPWAAPQTNILGYDITINGYITVNGSLSFSILPSTLIINDTLVIYGDLTLGTFTNLTVNGNGNGILIVRGKLTIGGFSNIITNNYVVITGDVLHLGSTNNGSFISNNNPVKVFIGGNISPSSLYINKTNFLAFNCPSTNTTPYPNSACSYGNMTDIINDPIYPFFQSTCTTATPTITAGGPTTFCSGGSVTLTSSSGTSYLWSNGATKRSINITASGTYTVKVTNSGGCQSLSSAATVVTVNALPATPTITPGGLTTFCTGGSVILTSSPGTSYVWSNGATTQNINVAISGSYAVKVTNTNGCESAISATTIVVVNANPVAVAGPDLDLQFTFDTKMNAELSAYETGEWSLISGSGHISDINSPTTRVTELSIGVNTFLWKAMNGSCEDTAEVKITVSELFVPSVITPNGDGKNDYFKISEFTGKVELIIINRWGNEEYTSDNYLNDWDGLNNKGKELPNDTYFYILKLENNIIKKGSVLIKR